MNNNWHHSENSKPDPLTDLAYRDSASPSFPQNPVQRYMEEMSLPKNRRKCGASSPQDNQAYCPVEPISPEAMGEMMFGLGSLIFFGACAFGIYSLFLYTQKLFNAPAHNRVNQAIVIPEKMGAVPERAGAVPEKSGVVPENNATKGEQKIGEIASHTLKEHRIEYIEIMKDTNIQGKKTVEEKEDNLTLYNLKDLENAKSKLDHAEKKQKKLERIAEIEFDQKKRAILISEIDANYKDLNETRMHYEKIRKSIDLKLLNR